MADFKSLRGDSAFVISALLFAALLVASNASAEGRCPSGQYPIGDQGVGGCAPIPGAGVTAREPGPAGQWHRRGGQLRRPTRPQMPVLRRAGRARRTRSSLLWQTTVGAVLPIAESSTRIETSALHGRFPIARAGLPAPVLPAPRTPPKRGSLPSSRASTPMERRVRLHTRTVRSRSMSHSDPLIGLSDWYSAQLAMAAESFMCLGAAPFVLLAPASTVGNDRPLRSSHPSQWAAKEWVSP